MKKAWASGTLASLKACMGVIGPLQIAITLCFIAVNHRAGYNELIPLKNI